MNDITKTEIMDKYMTMDSNPRFPNLHVFETPYGAYLLVVDGSQLFELDDSVAKDFSNAIATSDKQFASSFLSENGFLEKQFIDDTPVASPPIHALSLAVAQKCNLGCTYCYAEQGSFGSNPKNMSWEVAEQSILRLFENVKAGERVNLSFLGGEPLANRQLIYRATERAVEQAKDKNVLASFSITTNGTLLNSEDIDFFAKYGFAVTISLDGVGEVHNRLRVYKDGRGSYETVIANVKPLLQKQGKMQVSARVTVTPKNLRLSETLNHFIEMGFHSVGFSPMLSSPNGQEQMERAHLNVMLEQMIECGQEFERNVLAGRRYPFSNMDMAMQQIHKGVHRPYPCGAGASYLGVGATGELFACHRFVDDDAGLLGDVYKGVDQVRQNTWLAQRHVHKQEPCQSCWARYLCGGGCHHEVINRGRPSCDYIRGWLHYCLKAYVSISKQRPEFFNITPY